MQYRSVMTTDIELNVRIRFVTMDGQGHDRLFTFWDIRGAKPRVGTRVGEKIVISNNELKI
jgi:hypothetical protein